MAIFPAGRTYEGIGIYVQINVSGRVQYPCAGFDTVGLGGYCCTAICAVGDASNY